MFKTRITTALLATATLVNIAAAADTKLGPRSSKDGDTDPKGDPKGGTPNPKGEMIWDEQVIKDLYSHELAKEYADPAFPKVDTLDPGARCKDISATYSINMPLYEQSIGIVPFSVGVAGELKLEETNDKLSVTGSLGPSIDVFGEVHTPLDLKLSASTNAAGVNSVDVSITAFGYMLYTDNLADSTTPIQLIESFGWSLPDVFTAEIGDSYWIGDIGGRVRNAEASWKVSATAQAHVGGLVMFSVGTNGVQARAFVSNDAYAALVATATVTAEVDPPDFLDRWHDVKLDFNFTSTLDMIRSTFGGRGLLVPHNGHWLAEAGATLALTDTMGAHIGTTISIPIPIVDDPSYELSFFDLTPTEWNDTWNYSCTFDKQFK